MTPDTELRITARNKTAQAFGEVRAELQRTGMAMTGLQRTTAAIGSTISIIPRVFGAAFAGLGISELVRGITDATRDVAELGRQAKASGVSFEAYQELQYVFEKVHIEVSGLGQSLREMQDKASEFASTGGGRASDALKALGYDAKATAEALKDPEEMFKQIIDRLGDLDRAAQIRFLGDIFGNADGDKFIKLLDLGEQGINDLGDAAHENGRVLGDEMEAAAERADAAWTEWMGRLQAGWRTFSVGVVNFLANGEVHANAQQGIGFGLGGTGISIGGTPLPAVLDGDLMGLTPDRQPDKGMFGRGQTQTARSTFGFRDFLDKWDGSQLEFTGVSTSIDKAADSVKALDLGIDKITPKVETLADSIGDGLADAFTGLFSTMRQGGDVFDYLIGKAGGLADQLLNAGLQTMFKSLLGGIGGGLLGGGGGFVGSGFGSYGMYADGTMSASPGWAMVGEEGPELLRFRGGEKVVPHDQSMAMLGNSGGGGDTFFFNAYVTGSKEDAAPNARAFEQAARRVYLQMQRNPDRR